MIISQLRPSTVHASSSVISEAIHALTELLTAVSREYTATASSDTLETVLAKLQLLGARSVEEASGVASSSSGEATMNSNTEEKDDFQREINSRLPGALIILLNLLPSATSATVRLAAPALCRSVLVDSRHVWDSSSHDLQRVSLECCLTLTMDTDERVASLARATLDDFQSRLDSSEWRNHVDSVVAPRILELLREVSALSKSQREAELRTKLKLICGYLDLGSSTSALGKILVGEVDSGEMRKILIGES